MPNSLKDSAINNILAAAPSVTKAGSGAEIPYPFPSPADWRDHTIYFLLADRFNNPDKPPVSNAPDFGQYQGGTFEGIRQRLTYIKELGAGAIWISPVLMNPSWFRDYWGGYGIQDFMRIDPRFCSDTAKAEADHEFAAGEFRNLVDEAHALGLYVILDIVLNHAGNLFAYEGSKDEMLWNNSGEYGINWRNGDGSAVNTWTDIAGIGSLTPNAGIWPRELQRNDYFRRRGTYDKSPDICTGDFASLKELVTEYKIPETGIFPVRNILILIYQYLIARFDLDGYRIDTLQYVETDFARVFGNSMREYALSIGKKNFFTFGEVWDDNNDERIGEFVGRNSMKDNELIGVDAAIDFPMRLRLVQAAKGMMPPSVLAAHYEERFQKLKAIVSSHGEASRYFVTFLDNHDLNERFHNNQYPLQTSLAFTCLMTMQGIPCIYYGTEQGLDGRGTKREFVREALWGRPNAFDTGHGLYIAIQKLNELRIKYPALRYGRQYFRKCSADGVNFGYSEYNEGIIAFSRILNDKEILIAANTNTNIPLEVYIIVDKNLQMAGKAWNILYSNISNPNQPDKTSDNGDYRALKVRLEPIEAQVLI